MVAAAVEHNCDVILPSDNENLLFSAVSKGKTAKFAQDSEKSFEFPIKCMFILGLSRSKIDIAYGSYKKQIRLCWTSTKMTNINATINTVCAVHFSASTNL